MRGDVPIIPLCLLPGRWAVGLFTWAAGKGRAGRWLLRTGWSGVELLRPLVRRRLDPAGAARERQYAAWLVYHAPSVAEQADLIREARSLAYDPLVSIVMPVCDTDPRWLRRAIGSVRAQVYDRWELCLVDDASTSPTPWSIIDEVQQSDPRVRARRLDVRRGIVGASNEGLALATGEFVGFLDHDDELAPDALLEVARALNRDPCLDFLYSDEDKLDVQGRRSQPFFKPGWSPDLLLSHMYTGHFAVYRASLVKGLGGLRREFEGSQDYDLALRVTEATDRIHHIPRVLYYWRQAPGSAAASAAAKPYAYEAGRRAVADALRRRRVDGEVRHGPRWGLYEVRRRVRPERVTIVVPLRRAACSLARLVRSLERAEARGTTDLEVIAVAAGNVVVALPPRMKLPHRVVARPGAPRLSSLGNAGAAAATGDHLLFLDPHLTLTSAEGIERLLEHSQRPEVAAVGGRIVDRADAIRHAGTILGLGGAAGEAFSGLPAGAAGYFWRLGLIGNYSAVSGRCLMIRRRLFEELGGFDEAYDIAYHDVDLCLRARARGLLIVYTPGAVLVDHAPSGNREPAHVTDVARFTRRWDAMLAVGDPYYNPNLSLDRHDFTLIG